MLLHHGLLVVQQKLGVQHTELLPPGDKYPGAT